MYTNANRTRPTTTPTDSHTPKWAPRSSERDSCAPTQSARRLAGTPHPRTSLLSTTTGGSLGWLGGSPVLALAETELPKQGAEHRTMNRGSGGRSGRRPAGHLPGTSRGSDPPSLCYSPWGAGGGHNSAHLRHWGDRQKHLASALKAGYSCRPHTTAPPARNRSE